MNKIYAHNFFQEQKEKYRFVKNYCSGKILVCSSNQFFTYYSTKILNEKCDKIVTYFSHNKKLTERTIDNDSTIKIKQMEETITQLKNESFDSIISFETLVNGENFSDSLKKIYNLLRNDGILIISILNKDVQLSNKLSDELKEVCLTKEEFTSSLQSLFSEVNLFSQILYSNNRSKSDIIKNFGKFRSIGASILKKVDKNRNFYINNLQNTMKKIDGIKDNIVDISQEDFIPKKFLDNQSPFYLIAICKK